MNLFHFDAPANILPYDGDVSYRGRIFDLSDADRLLKELIQAIPWEPDVCILFGKRHVTARKIAWFGDRNFGYSYSGSRKHALPWSPVLLEIKDSVEHQVGRTFNSCLLNHYSTGSEGMGWHSDDESELGPNPVIASVSFGAERKFVFRHKRSNESVSIILEHGSLLIMAGVTQQYWKHTLPKTKRISEPRVNLTFRSIHS